MVTQFWVFYVYMSHVIISAEQGGLKLNYDLGAREWDTQCFRPQEWSFDDFLAGPGGNVEKRGVQLYLPWWLLILGSSLFMALFRAFTRGRKGGQAFPVEPAAK